MSRAQMVERIEFEDEGAAADAAEGGALAPPDEGDLDAPGGGED